MMKNKIKGVFKSPIIYMILTVVFSIILSHIETSRAITTYLYDSKDVSYDNTESGIIATDVQGAVDELYACASDYSSIRAMIYPVGSIYLSITDDTVAKVEARYGGTWVAFGAGRTLIGMGSNGTNDYTTVEDTGGASSHAIEVSNLPVHNHSIPALSGSTNSTGSHNHKVSSYRYHVSPGAGGTAIASWSDMSSANYTENAGSHSHTVTTTASNTNGCTDCSGTALNTQDPYITVYMWKRTA